MYLRSSANGPKARPVRRSGQPLLAKLTAKKTTAALGTVVTLVAIAAPAAAAAVGGQASFNVSGALKGALKQSPPTSCIPGPEALNALAATFTIQGKLQGGGPVGTLYAVEITTSSLKGGTWALGPGSKAHATFVEQVSKELYWVASGGKVTTTPTSGSINAKFAPEKGLYTPKGDLSVKGSWKC